MLDIADLLRYVVFGSWVGDWWVLSPGVGGEVRIERWISSFTLEEEQHQEQGTRDVYLNGQQAN